MAELSHFDWPYQLGVDVEQDTPQDLRASAAVIVCTPRGRRDDDPSFGVTTPVFEPQPVDTTALAREITQSDSRLTPAVSEVIDLTNAVLAVINVDVTGGSA